MPGHDFLRPPDSLLAQHLRDDKNKNGSPEAAAQKHVY